MLDYLLVEDGGAVWVDAHGHGTTQPLARIAPSMRVLERIAIARAFTPWQHHSLLNDLHGEVTDETALIVLPAFDYFSRSEECSDREGEHLLSAGCALVSELADTLDVPIVLTQTTDDEFAAPITALAGTVVRCERTDFGPRFMGEDVETLVYPLENGLVQTTVAYWQCVLTARHPALATTSTLQEVAYGLH